MTPEEKLKSMGLELPKVPTPMGNYVPCKLDGKTIYLAGQGPRRPDGSSISGRVGEDVTIEQAYELARGVGLSLLAVAKTAAGDLGINPRQRTGIGTATPIRHDAASRAAHAVHGTESPTPSRRQTPFGARMWVVERRLLPQILEKLLDSGEEAGRFRVGRLVRGLLEFLQEVALLARQVFRRLHLDLDIEIALLL